MRNAITAARGGCIKHVVLRVLMILAVLGLSALASAPAFAHDTVYYFMTDALHSTVVVTDQNRNIVEETHYGPYGLVLNRQLRDGPGYGGHTEDPATGLVYMQQRYYDPQAGRFISTDPVLPAANGSNFNRYWYAKDNPYRYTDPDGRCADGTCGVMVRSVGEAISDSGSTTLSPVAKVGLAIMLSATGVDEAAGAVGAVRVAGRYIAGKIAGNVTREAETTTAAGANPYKGPVDHPVTVVDKDGNAIPVNKGESIGASQNGKYQQVKDSTGQPTGVRLDKGGHSGHADPKAQAPHAHRPGVTDATGNPHLPIKPPKLQQDGG